jgi:hypothetical protein
MIDSLHIWELVVWYRNLLRTIAVGFGIIGNTEGLGCILRRRIKVVAPHEVWFQTLSVSSFVPELTPRVVISVGTSIKLHPIHV